MNSEIKIRKNSITNFFHGIRGEHWRARTTLEGLLVFSFDEILSARSVEKTLSKEVGGKGKGEIGGGPETRGLKDSNFDWGARNTSQKRVEADNSGKKRPLFSSVAPYWGSRSFPFRPYCENAVMITLCVIFWKKRWKVEVTLLKLKYNNNKNYIFILYNKKNVYNIQIFITNFVKFLYKTNYLANI